MNLTKIILLTAALTFSLNNSALTITNYNTKDIMVEIVDCPSLAWYGYPTTRAESCSTFAKGTCTTFSNLSKVDFLHLTHLHPNEVLALHKEYNSDLPEKVCLKITGQSSTTGIREKVKNTCDITVYDNGFLSGIRAEYNNCN